MSNGESHKFHLFKRPSKNGSTYPEQKCNRDATPDQNRAPGHVRLSLPSAFIHLNGKDRSALDNGDKSFRE